MKVINLKCYKVLTEPCLYINQPRNPMIKMELILALFTNLFQTTVRNIWLGQDLKTGTDAPRFHHQLIPMEVSYEKDLSQVSCLQHSSVGLYSYCICLVGQIWHQ